MVLLITPATMNMQSRQLLGNSALRPIELTDKIVLISAPAAIFLQSKAIHKVNVLFLNFLFIIKYVSFLLFTSRVALI